MNKSLKYPILLVHGYGARDQGLLACWGRLPAYLEGLGLDVHLSSHDSYGTVSGNAIQLAEIIHKLAPAPKKMHIIAHSKGGLDVREALEITGVRERVASLITLGTPHNGIEFIEKLSSLPSVLKSGVTSLGDKVAKLLGDEDPATMQAFRDMSPAVCQERNERLPIPEDLPYLAVAGACSRLGSCIDLTVNYHYLSFKDCPSDGLVPIESALFGPRQEIWRAAGDSPGISHHDLCDFHQRDLRIERCQLNSESNWQQVLATPSAESDKVKENLNLFGELISELAEYE